MSREQTPRERGVKLAHSMREQLYGRGAYKELHDLSQWLNWQFQLINGELKKVPINPRNGHKGSTINPLTWGTLPQALKRVEFGKVDGIGFVVTQNDPYCIVDIDGSADKQKRIITSELGLRVVKMLHTITEFSPNNGLHMVVELEKPLPEAVKNDVELYFTERYMTVTTDLIPNSPLVIATRQKEIEALFEEFKGVPFSQAFTTPTRRVRESTRSGRVGRVGVMEATRDWRDLPGNTFEDDNEIPARPDEAVLTLARGAPNREAFLELWENRWMQNPKYKGDDSHADWQLTKYLLYWTGNHKSQTNRLFERSGLMRSKWRDRVNSGGSGHSYGEVTIHNAVAFSTWQT